MPATDSPGGGPGSLRRGVGELEAEVLGVLRAAGQALSPGDVRERLEVRDGRALSYSTVVTIVSRLHAKGLLSRQRAGRGPWRARSARPAVGSRPQASQR